MLLAVSTSAVASVHFVRRSSLVALGVLGAFLSLATSCGSSTSAGSGTVNVVATENFWGSIATQLAGSHATVRSIIANPQTDPHAYEPTASDARAIAGAAFVIENGAGYDPWAQKLIDANPSSSRAVLDVGKLNGVAEGGNPHMWYSPTFVRKVIDAVTAQLQSLDSADGTYFATQHDTYTSTGLKQYDDLRAEIKQKYSGTPVGATESIFAYMAPDLGLNLISPPGFLKAISEGTDPTAADKATMDSQITSKRIKVLVFNSQNSTPDVQALVDKARAKGILVTSVTETLDPANVTFQDWQSRQLQALIDALAGAR
ncbi:MAG TPA: ABC transporter substrate-binding protein [Chloroflexi bacterium]|jgi:zinc/manganese transport system substrate-binding protein|nr:ABC transporter substrate-binding protein [Chloroflexota bacterium]HAF20951.1 ABC transporter substrate-binding protein [Chloroflexota bacterium]